MPNVESGAVTASKVPRVIGDCALRSLGPAGTLPRVSFSPGGVARRLVPVPLLLFDYFKSENADKPSSFAFRTLPSSFSPMVSPLHSYQMETDQCRAVS